MSLRSRLLIGLGLVAVVLVGAAVVVTTTTRSDLVRRVDAQLWAASESMGGRGPWTGGAGVRPGPLPDQITVERGPATLWLGIRDAEGTVASLAAPLGRSADEVHPDLGSAVLAELETDRLATVDGVGVGRFRVIARDGPAGTTWLVGAPLDGVDASTQRLVLLEVGATVLVLALLGLVAWWVLRLGVRPLQRMTVTAEAIAGGELSQRVDEVDPGTEAGRLGTALNVMLTRIEDAFAARTASEERLRRFVADASHELRTPITTIRGYAELHRRGGLDDPVARDSAMARTEQEAVRMGALVDDLLLLARLDEGRPLAADPVDVTVLATDAATDTRAAHPGRAVTLDVPSEAVVIGDEDRLRQVVANLVGNAVRHTPGTASVAIAVGRDGDDVVLTVADDGPGMAPELAGRAFERFARGDVARSRAAGSTGLGLSIVEAIVTAHGGQVALDSVEGRGTSVTVRLPGVGRPPAGSAG